MAGVVISIVFGVQTGVGAVSTTVGRGLTLIIKLESVELLHGAPNVATQVKLLAPTARSE
ncbi:hypothetical protein D3C87_985840 [compost metagenome]